MVFFIWYLFYLRKVLIYMASLSPLPKENLLHCDIVGCLDFFTCCFPCFLVHRVFYLSATRFWSIKLCVFWKSADSAAEQMNDIQHGNNARRSYYSLSNGSFSVNFMTVRSAPSSASERTCFMRVGDNLPFVDFHFTTTNVDLLPYPAWSSRPTVAVSRGFIVNLNPISQDWLNWG